jgi:hypothetical protein
MNRISFLRSKPLWLATLGLCALVGTASAEQAKQDPLEQGTIDWRKANDEVSQFERGHADVLKWDRANASSDKEMPALTPDLMMPTADEAVRQAWRAHPEWAVSLAHLGAANQAHIASGNWLELDPIVRRRVEAFDEILESAAQARKAWFEVVAAQAGLKLQYDIEQAYATAGELARRMVRVGNWSRLEQAESESRLVAVKQQTLKTELEAQQAQVHLLKATRLWGIHSRIGLPESLSDLPKQAISADTVEKALMSVRAVLPRTEAKYSQNMVSQAFAAYKASYSMAQLAKDEQKLNVFMYDETVLRYNGMLLSVWDLLAQSSAKLHADAAVVTSQRDFLMAQTNLQMTLQGLSPAN